MSEAAIPTEAPPVESSAKTDAPAKLAKVVHVINGEHYSGAERVQDLLGKCLPQFGYDASFVCVKPGKFAEARAAEQCPIFDLPMRHRFDLWQAKQLADLVKAEQFEVIHAHTPRTAMLAMGASYLTKVPFVYHVHSPTSRDSTRKLQNWVNQKIEQTAIANASQLVCVSNSLAGHMRSLGVSDNRLTVVHNGVPCVANVPERELPSGVWTLGTVALFRPRKGLEVLLDAMAQLREQGHLIRLRAVGPFETPEYEATIHERVQKLKLEDAIDWVGFTRDVNAQFSQMDLFVLPSLFGEGLPMVVLESMAAGTPVVATDVEGVTEAITDSESGIIAKPNDAEHLAQRIEAVLTGREDWRKIRTTALARHAESFSDVAMARGVAGVYDQILGKQSTQSSHVTNRVTCQAKIEKCCRKRWVTSPPRRGEVSYLWHVPYLPLDGSMVISREFVTWDRPILHSAADWLIQSATVSPENLPLVDLSHCLVVVPGGLAGRRLTELLIQKVEKEGRSLIPPGIITVGQLPEYLYEAELPFASELTQQFAWGETLRAFGNEQLKPLIPFPPDANDLGTWRDYGDSVRRVYRELVSYAFDFAEVAQKAHSLEDFTEQPRWDVLAKLQNAYLARLDALKVWDKQSARRYAIKHNECHSDAHIVLLATVDLNRATRQMLDQVAGKGGKITAIVGAPESWSNHFDEHGCLIADAWTDETIELDWKSVAIVDGPTQQADEAAGAIAAVADKYTAKDVIVGLPDENLLGEVRRIFGQHGLKCRFGPGRPVISTLPFRLIETIIELSQTRQYHALASALRHPDLFATLKFAQPGIEKLDDWFNNRLPDVIDNSIQNEEVSQAVAQLNELASPFVGQKRSLPEWADQVRELLLAVYGSQIIDLDTEANFELARPLQAINEAMAQWNDIPESLSQAFGASEMLRVLKSQLTSSMIPAEHDPDAIEALGWLELPLMDAPVCVVTSFNDGLIPSANTADLFLPNSLRNLLGLEDDSLRYARDAYQVQVIQHSREVVKWIVPKRSADGDPLAPSRLLFTGGTSDLAPRVVKFFGTPEDPQNQAKQPGTTVQDHRQRIAIPVPDNLDVLEMPAWDRFSATRINQYLKCPYRFFLKYVMGLQGEDDWSTELDGGAFGNLAHDTLQAFGTSDVKNSTDEKVIFDYLSSQLSEVAAKRYGKSPLATIKLQIEQLRLRLRAFAAGQALQRQEGWVIHRCEAEIAGPYPTIEVDGVEIELEGRIDRIDHHPETGQWAVWDYKTGDSTGDPEKDHQIGPRDDKKWVSVQLPFYRHLVKSIGIRGEVSLGYITLPKLGEEVRFRQAKWNDDDLDTADATIIQAIRDIRAGVFFPPGEARYEDEFSRICQDTVLGKWEPAP